MNCRNKVSSLLLSTFLLSFTLVFIFFSNVRVFAQDICKNLELELKKLTDENEKIKTGLKNSDILLMKAQEKLLIARATGNAQEGMDAQQAIQVLQESISKFKAALKKNEESIAITKDLLNLCKGDECNTILSKIHQTRVALKRNIQDARNQSKDFLELTQELENLRETQSELKNLANRIEFILNTLDVTGAFSSVQLLNKLKDSITLSAIQFSKSNLELYQEMKYQFDKEMPKLFENDIAKLNQAQALTKQLKSDLVLAKKFVDLGLDLDDLLVKISKAKDTLKKLKYYNNLLKVTEYIYKTLYLNVSYYLLEEELSERLYVTEKTAEALEALTRELKREMDIYQKCKKIGKIK